jgi:hypothetical protein
MKICSSLYNPVKNWQGHPTMFPLDQRTHTGYCWDKTTNAIWYWDRFQCPEKIISGCPYVQFGTLDTARWEQKANLLAIRFLRKPDEDCFLSYKDGDKNNANLFNLEWIPKEKKWLGETSKNAAGIRGIATINKKLRNGTTVIRYKVKTTAGFRTFETKEEAIKHLELSTAGGDDAMTIIDSDEYSVALDEPNYQDAVPDTFIEKEEQAPEPSKEYDWEASARHTKETMQMTTDECRAYHFTGGWDYYFSPASQGHSTWRAEKWTDTQELNLRNFVIITLTPTAERLPWVKPWLEKFQQK